MTFFKKYWLIISIIFFGGIIRLYGLSHNPIGLASDEVDMGYQAYSLLKTGCDYSGFCLPIQFHSFSDVQPPIPIYLIALLNVLGFQLDISIRLVSAISGVLGIFITYLLIKNLKSIFSINYRHLESIVALILAILPWHFTYSRIGFALSTLYIFFVTGLYFYTEYIQSKKNLYLILALIFLALTPTVYNTAKMAIIFYPFILLTIPGTWVLFRSSRLFQVGLILMYLPLLLLFISGQTSARFDYISIFSDPTISTEINHQRLTDSGPSAPAGTSPSLLTKIIHNKVVFVGNNFLHNSISLLSTTFLFLDGDPNPRHSVPGWGLLYKIFLPIFFLGIISLATHKDKRIFWLLLLLTLTAVSVSAVTREGSAHASRSFMLILPLILVVGIGFSALLESYTRLFWFCFAILMVEFGFYQHSYWTHYPMVTERVWGAVMPKAIGSLNPDFPAIISQKYENPLIFYLFYQRFDPKTFQGLVKNKKLYQGQSGSTNLNGDRIGDSNLYIATLADCTKKPSVTNGQYLLTKAEVDNCPGFAGKKVSEIRTPSGELIYYLINY